MAANMGNGGRRNRWRWAIWGTAAGLLLLPWVAMRLDAPGVDWSGGDFVAMGLLLFGACGLYEVAARMSGDLFYRAGTALAVLIGFLTAWSNLAVGIIGNENDALNLMFFGVVGIALFGALAVRFRARGLVAVMTAAGVAQALAAVLGWLASGWENGVLIALFFSVPWLASAELFRRAGDAPVARK